jgi:hypothetical protein
VDSADLAFWQTNVGFFRMPLAPGSGSGSVVPEPGAIVLAMFSVLWALIAKTRTTRPAAGVYFVSL